MTLAQTIDRFDLWHLALPVVSVRDHGIGRVAGACEVVVLRLGTSDGGVGWGEASPWAVFTGTPEAAFAALDRYMRPLVVGQPISARADIMEKARLAVAFCTDAKAALETALLDLEGRVLGRSVADVLGGVKQSRVPLSVSLANPDFDADRALLARLAEDGVGIVKLKTGFAGGDFDLMRLKALKQDFPNISVRVDYNQGLRGPDFLDQVKAVADLGPDFIEQPVPADRFDDMAAIRAVIDIPLLADESVFGPEDLKRAIREGICDGVSIKIMKAGGLTRAQETARLAADAGLSAYGGDMFESGLAHLAGAHMIAATPEITLGCEFYQARYYLETDILAAPFPCDGGYVTLPDGPGLGIQPDEDVLDRFAIRKAVT